MISAKGENTSPTVLSATATAFASDENILWVDERCAMCLTSGLAGSFVHVRWRKSSRTRSYYMCIYSKYIDTCTCAWAVVRISLCDMDGGRVQWWLEGLYRFVDETTVIRHCVWPHPRLCQDLWTPYRPRYCSWALLSLLVYRSPCYQFRSAVWLVTTVSLAAVCRCTVLLSDRISDLGTNSLALRLARVRNLWDT